MTQTSQDRPAGPTARTARRARSATAAFTVAGLALGALLLGGGPASAKSAVTVTVSTRTLRVGQTVRVTGSGADDSARYTYLCVDTRTGSGDWHPLSCATQPFTPASASVRAARRGAEQFRARLLTRAYPGGPPHQDRVSAATTVLVH